MNRLKSTKEAEKPLSEMEQKSVSIRLLFQKLREITPTIAKKLIYWIEIHNPKSTPTTRKGGYFLYSRGGMHLPDAHKLHQIANQIRNTPQIRHALHKKNGVTHLKWVTPSSTLFYRLINTQHGHDVFS